MVTCKIRYTIGRIQIWDVDELTNSSPEFFPQVRKWERQLKKPWERCWRIHTNQIHFRMSMILLTKLKHPVINLIPAQLLTQKHYNRRTGRCSRQFSRDHLKSTRAQFDLSSVTKRKKKHSEHNFIWGELYELYRTLGRTTDLSHIFSA